jgi:hypothetical protein
MQLAYAACNQLGVLRTEIKDEYFVVLQLRTRMAGSGDAGAWRAGARIIQRGSSALP